MSAAFASVIATSGMDPSGTVFIGCTAFCIASLLRYTAAKSWANSVRVILAL